MWRKKTGSNHRITIQKRGGVGIMKNVKEDVKMRSINLQVPEDLYLAYKKVCFDAGTKLRHPIILKMREVAYGYK